MPNKKSTYDKVRDINNILEVNIDKTATNYKSSAEILLGMFSGTKTKKTIDFDGVTITLRLINITELMQARENALTEFNKKPELARYPADLQFYMMLHILDAALSFSPSPHEKFENSPTLTLNELRLMTENQVTRLYEEFIVFDKEYNPDIDRMSVEEFNIMLDEIKKNQDYLYRASYRQLLRISSYFINLQLLAESQTDK